MIVYSLCNFTNYCLILIAIASQLVSFIDDSEGGTPDDLMKSMEAVKME